MKHLDEDARFFGSFSMPKFSNKSWIVFFYLENIWNQKPARENLNWTKKKEREREEKKLQKTIESYCFFKIENLLNKPIRIGQNAIIQNVFIELVDHLIGSLLYAFFATIF